jgi:hypothetical protein
MRESAAVIFATICFRWFNLIATGEVLLNDGLLFKWDVMRAKRVLMKVRDSGAQIFTGAYTVNARTFVGPPGSIPGRAKTDVVCERIDNVWRDRTALIIFMRQCTTLQGAHKFLQKYPGMGGTGFSAYEVVTDLRYTSTLEHATDKLTWCNPGPGALRGLRRLLEIDQSYYGHRLDNWQEAIIEVLAKVQRRLPKLPKFEMREIEHSLCEWDKYERVRTGEGRSKRLFKGR